jgi:hypothetical protein
MGAFGRLAKPTRTGGPRRGVIAIGQAGILVGDAMSKLDNAMPEKPSPQAKRSAGEREEPGVRYFFSFGVALTFIALAVLMIAVLPRLNSDSIGTALIVLAFFSIAIWGGIALVAVPTLLATAVLRARRRRGLTYRADVSATWDDWIDGPRFP